MMAVSREAYFTTGLATLSDLGYSGLKLAEVCGRLGVTTGSFYHYFTNWSAYTDELIDYWLHERTLALAHNVASQPDPRRRIERLLQDTLTLQHGAEAAIRVWSALDPKVRAVQAEVDRQRFQSLHDAAFAILQDKRQAEVFAECGLFALVGYEQSTLPRDENGLACIIEQLLTVLDSGQFATVPNP